jgi:hypothetical protein
MTVDEEMMMMMRAFLAAAAVLLLPASALATGTLRIQQSNNSVQTYSGVVMKLDQKNHALMLTSADKVSTVAITGGHCTPEGKLVRCTGGGFSLRQEGKTYVIPFKSATFYFNLSEQEQASPLAAVRPHSVVFDIVTRKGTHITGNGKLDEEG